MKSTPPPLLTEPVERASRRVFLIIVALVVVAGVITLWLCARDGTRSSSGRSVEIADSKETTENSTTERQDSAVIDYSSSNVVSVRLGMENPNDGVLHLAKERDGRTTIETLNGSPCRYLNRKTENKLNGFLYFAIEPSFKSRELKNARIDVECFVTAPRRIRLQYDGMDNGKPKVYKSTTAVAGEKVYFGNVVAFSGIQPSNDWQIISFRVTNGVFLNSQNGGSDFRLEVSPPEIYVRQVTVTREDI